MYAVNLTKIQNGKPHIDNAYQNSFSSFLIEFLKKSSFE